MTTRLLLAAALALTLGACESSGSLFGDGDARSGSTAVEPGEYGSDDGVATGTSGSGGLGDDCRMRRVGDENANNSLVCE
ncbi:hypothetical protein [Azospirillum sp. ST 5-10]|uniref:hypothetical protein n=1 Tax=unclassified Azospirillum TaxID=2630922 RepID=UPI003F4A3F4B